MLLFREGQFLQLLEGPEREVKSVYEIVKRDPRHTALKVLLSEEVAERQFSQWTMGFERLDEVWSVPRAWTSILEDGLNSSSLTENPSRAKDLLLTFQHILHEPA